jgi:hypothetical protein
MRAVEHLAEPPELTSEERSVVRRRLRELDERDELQFLHESADAMFQDLDKQEADNAHRKAAPYTDFGGQPGRAKDNSPPIYRWESGVRQ